MIVNRPFYNVKCDHCRCLLDEESWYPDETTAEIPLSDTGWRKLGGKHYCEDCWSWDDDDNIVTKDGRKFNGETGEEILTIEQRYHLDYLKDLTDPRLTLTQLRIEIIKATKLYHSMVGWLYKGALKREIDGALSLLNDRHASASESEKEIYDTFREHRIFYHLQQEGFPDNGKHVNIY